MSLVNSQHLEDSNDCSAKPRHVVGTERPGRVSPRTASGRYWLGNEDTLTVPCLTQLAPSDFSLRAAT